MPEPDFRTHTTPTTATPKLFVIYKHTSPSGKSYIGQTCDLEVRNRQHQSRAGCPAFSSAIRKHGWDSFTHEVLEAGLSADEANEKEAFYIAAFGTLSPFGYNLQTGGGNSRPSTETRLKLSAYARNRPAEVKAKQSQARRGIKFSDQHRENIAIAGRTRAPISEETRRRLSESVKNRDPAIHAKGALKRVGSKASDEAKARISEAKKNQSVETRQRISQALTGKKLSPESIAKRTASRKKIDPSYGTGMGKRKSCTDFRQLSLYQSVTKTTPAAVAIQAAFLRLNP